MKKFLFYVSAVLVAFGSYAQEKTVTTLDLTQAVVEYNFADGTFALPGTPIDCQIFTISSGVNGWNSDYNTYGLNVSKNADSWNNSADFTTKTYSSNNWFSVEGNEAGCMAEGGISSIAEDGTVTVSKDSPYLVAYWDAGWNGIPNLYFTFNDNVARECKGIYIAAHPWPFHSYFHGDGFARAFVDGDYHKVIVHALDEAGNEVANTVEVFLAKYEDGMLSVLKNWKYVDLSSLGKVSKIYFTMETTDSGAYGPNTASYFCLDKLQVIEPEVVAVETTMVDDNAPVEYYDMQGVKVENPTNGVYVKKQGDKATKVVL